MAMNFQNVIRSATRSFLLNTGRQYRDPDSNLNGMRPSECDCAVRDEQHLQVTFVCGRSGAQRRVCGRVGESLAELAERSHVSLNDAENFEAYLLWSLRPIYVDNAFYSNLRGPGRRTVLEEFDKPVTDLCNNKAQFIETILTKQLDGLQITLM